MIENIEQLKKAIEIEIQYKYIDIHGKTQAFSTFIKNEAKKYYKLSKKILNGLLLQKLLSTTLLPA